MFIKRYRINLFIISCCFISIIRAQDPSDILAAFEGIKEKNLGINPSYILKTDTINFSKISWFDSSEKSNYINVIDADFKEITLPHNNAFVKFEFNLQNSRVTTKNNFKYKLGGLYNNWRLMEKTNELTFIHIPPGDYTLYILDPTETDNSNITTLKIPIIVTQIYYKKWWFITALTFLLAALLFYIRKYELSHLKKIEALKLKISRNLHDELGSALTGIAIKSDLLLEIINLESKKKYLLEIAEQSRNAVDTLSDIVWVINSNNNNIQNLTERMESLLYQLLTPLNITFTLQSHQKNKSLQINQDHRQHVFLIFKEAITNIMKHSNASNVFVSFTKEKSKMKLIIKDNGTKINQEYRTLNGNGIKNMKLRTEKIHGKIRFTYDKGFTVSLFFNYLRK